MFHQQDYDLSRLRYQEYTAQLDALYVSVQGRQPALVRRLWAALQGSPALRALRTARRDRTWKNHDLVVMNKSVAHRNTCHPQTCAQECECAT